MRPVSRKTLAQSFQCARAVGKQKIFIEFVKRRARVDATRELRCYTLFSPPLPSSSLSTNHTCGSHTHTHFSRASQAAGTQPFDFFRCTCCPLPFPLYAPSPSGIPMPWRFETNEAAAFKVQRILLRLF